MSDGICAPELGGCGRTRETHAEGARGDYCRRCYRRWHDAGFPAGGPPAPRRAGGGNGVRAARLEDYQELLSWGLTPQQAQWRLGVCRTTILRYERLLAAQSENHDRQPSPAAIAA